MRTILVVDTAAAQDLLFGVLGAVVGAAAVLAWRVSSSVHAHSLRASTEANDDLPDGVATVLSVLRSSALVVDTDDHALTATSAARSMGVLNGDRLADDELLALVRQVRRDGQIRETELLRQRQRGKPARHLAARVTPLGSRLVLLLLEDRTRERQVEAIRRDFVANVSHELKTPVGAIRLLAEAVNDASDDPEAVQRFAARMGIESQRLGRLVQQIIELSRLQDDDPLEELGTVDVDRIVDRVVDENQTDALSKQIKVVRDGDTGLQVLGNREQISLAVGNLISNAVSYSPEGSTVLVTAKAAGAESVSIAVTDQGIGIPEQEIDRIFERFYRVDPARHRSTGGTGLGLSIVKHIVASHGGDVRVWSVEGQGSTFTVTLPRKAAAPVASQAAPREPAPVGVGDRNHHGSSDRPADRPVERQGGRP